MSLANFHRTIGGSLYFQDNIDIGLWALGGGFRGLTDPVMWWYNGSTYAVGYENNVTNNKVWIVKQTYLAIESSAVNNGTSVSEPLNHPTPLLYINESTGYIYVIQNQFHVDAFEVWKSDLPENISSFTSIGVFDTDGSYLTMNKFSGTNVTFTTRSGEAPNGYDHSILEVDLDSTGSYIDTLVCDGNYSTNNTRFYGTDVKRYGTSDYYVGGAALRDDALFTVFIRGIWITQDFDTYEDIAQTFSKDVVSTSALTWAEFTTNLNEFGTDGDHTVNYGAGSIMQIDNDIYTVVVTDTNEITLYKFTIGTSGIVASLVIPYSISSIDSFYMYYNNTNIVCHFKTSDADIFLGVIDTSLSAFTLKKQLDLPDGDYVGLPWNLNDVDSSYLIASRSVNGDNGNVPYIITDDVWN